jgi:hypothetical protein
MKREHARYRINPSLRLAPMGHDMRPSGPSKRERYGGLHNVQEIGFRMSPWAGLEDRTALGRIVRTMPYGSSIGEVGPFQRLGDPSNTGPRFSVSPMRISSAHRMAPRQHEIARIAESHRRCWHPIPVATACNAVSRRCWRLKEVLDVQHECICYLHIFRPHSAMMVGRGEVDQRSPKAATCLEYYRPKYGNLYGSAAYPSPRVAGPIPLPDSGLRDPVPIPEVLQPLDIEPYGVLVRARWRDRQCLKSVRSSQVPQLRPPGQCRRGDA